MSEAHIEKQTLITKWADSLADGGRHRDVAITLDEIWDEIEKIAIREFVGRLHVISDHLVEETGVHTCAGGGAEVSGMHEPACGYEMLTPLKDITIETRTPEKVSVASLTRHGPPTLVFPANGIVALVAWDNTTIDMTYEQATELGILKTRMEISSPDLRQYSEAEKAQAARRLVRGSDAGHAGFADLQTFTLNQGESAMSDRVTARFYVHEITENNTDYSKVVLKPVVRAGGLPGAAEADAANKPWSKYTPSGEWWMNVHNETGAVDTFRRAMREKKDLDILITLVE